MGTHSISAHYRTQPHTNLGHRSTVALCDLNHEEEVSSVSRNTKQTSRKAASTASKVLRDGRYSKAAMTAAGSALAQTKPSKR